ncbi:hypothetical protein GCM10007304_30870 [Rhodococcoides trifolii]|uniref:DUF1003 domain-containing protein n=1 Tax=Rhodococcoides trifolii TaxID=908250 RepID=A0A917FYZ8_9NOCA|nr:DUF1003 domain-containing protein [Rhodococcus trifolii]GGG14683.1 hypothetical protein GCM10007304_30870 [Rhodococcus trifolii]
MSDKTSQAARQRLDTPRGTSRFKITFDPEAIGRTGETVARFLGTGRYLTIQTVIVIIWILLNVFAVKLQWDPYPFILLNLAFSTQAAYAAPLILLAQNRQDDRDRVSLEEDRSRAAQTKADTEFLARELAALRIAVGEVATRDYLRRELDDFRDDLKSLLADPSSITDDDTPRPRKKPRKKQVDETTRSDNSGDTVL